MGAPAQHARGGGSWLAFAPQREPGRVPADHEAQETERRRESIERRIARVDEAIAQWHRLERNQARPLDEQLPVMPPDLSLADCLDVRRMLDEELTRLG